MAFPFSERQSVAVDQIIRRAADLAFKQQWMVDELAKRGRISIHPGDFIRQPIWTDGTGNFQYYSQSDNLSTAPNTNIRSAKFEMARMYDAFTVSQDEIEKTSGDVAALMLFEEKARIMAENLRNNLSTEIFSANADLASPPKIVGLRTLCAAGTTDYGGIDSNDLANWAPNRDTSTTQLTLAKIADQIAAIKANGASDNLILVSTWPIWSKISAGLIGSSFQRVVANEKNLDANVLAREFTVLGYRFRADQKCPGTGSGTDDSHLFGLDMDHLKFYVTPESNYRVRRLGDNLPTQDVVGRQIFLAAQMVADKRNAFFVMTTLDPGE